MDKSSSIVALMLYAAASLYSSAAAEVAAGQSQEKRWEASSEKKYKIEFDVAPPVQYCKSRTSIEYYQDNETAQVNGEINVEDCTNASGKYTISVRFRDAEGQTHNLDFDETWQRETAAAVKFSHVYDLAANVDLIRVRARRTRCVCADAEAPGEEQEKSPPIEPRKDQ